jgi:acetyl-CoA synthetase
MDVVDSIGLRVRRTQVGELVCRRPWPGMTRGIWGDNERYLETYWSRFPDVWTHGDWASIDEDDYWYLHGRSDDTLNIAGKRIGPAELESAAISSGIVAEAAAIGVPHALKGEAAWIFWCR